MYQVHFTSSVQDDVSEAVEYYRQFNPQLANQFIFRIREAIYFLIRAPFACQIKYKDVRTLILKQFPFHIHYIINESKQEIVILAIIHAYRNPNDYSSRL